MRGESLRGSCPQPFRAASAAAPARLSMSLFHQCAVGFFEPSSLVIGEVLHVRRPLGPDDVRVLAAEYLRCESPTAERRAMWWEDGYVVVEYIALQQIVHRVRFVRALMALTGCDVVDVAGRTVRGAPWPRK